MCGIAGILSHAGELIRRDEVHAMCSTLVHRGPDDEGIYTGPGIGIGMRRLSIIDLDSGRQPVHNEDRTIWVVFNGEIYNFQELRLQLEKRGHRFYTRTDTEAIVHLYEDYGDDCVERLRGMFAFAIWDERRRRLLLARDRLGIKPLYYAAAGGRVLFASELKAILRMPEVERKLNWGAVSHLFAFLSTPPAEAVIEGVNKLEPGHVLTAAPGEPPVVQRYWELPFEPERGRTEPYFSERLRELLHESVHLHLVSDVPVGAFLSGGVDSSSVVALAARANAGPLQTFSIGFAEHDYNEVDHARTVARLFPIEHHELIVRPDVVEYLDDIAWHLDEPFGDSSAIPTYMVSKLASQFVKVVLSGDGGDELFAGYQKYLVERRERRYELLPKPLRTLLAAAAWAMPETVRGRNFFRHLALDGSERYLDACTLFRLDEMRKLFRPEAFEFLAGHSPWLDKLAQLNSGDGNWLSRLQLLDVNNYLPLDILTKVDRMSMAHSIETRVPLLDHKLVEFAATIPPELHLQGRTTKRILKRAMRGLVPEAVLRRPKQGFGVPLSYWFRGKLGEYVRDVLLGETSRRRGLFSASYVETLLESHQKGRELDLHLWTLLSFELWARTFLDRPVRQESAVPA
jgi:asparagine synthase (glutamine-hydrolysing)